MSKTQLAIIFVTRTVLNTAHRIIYPFLPSIARGLNVSLAVAGGLVTVRLGAGLIAPLLGPLADRFGRRRTMEAGLVIFTAASLLLAGSGLFPVAVVAFASYGLSKVLYDPAVHAFLSDTVPYSQRGRVIGTVELAWSSAWLLGVPAAGFLIEHLGWRAPWIVLVGLGLVSLWLTRIGLTSAQDSPGATPADSPTISPPRQKEPGPFAASVVHRWRTLLHEPRIVVLLLTSLLLMAALEIPFIVYGAWLETAFGLSLSTLGLASIVVGLAEASAELGVTVLTDRLGKKRSVLVGLLGLAAGLAVLPGFAHLGPVAGLGGIVLAVLTFEFGLVSLLPIATELAPDARAALLSLNMAAMSLGRILGAVAGGWLWKQTGDIAPNALAGSACALVAAVVMSWGMVEIAE
ncbi:MAG: MFS transporter [Anaerolineae bacterium]